MLIAAKSPPIEVTLLYRNLGMTHVFIAENFRGFHVGLSMAAAEPRGSHGSSQR